MDSEKNRAYAESLQKLIRIETVSDPDCGSSPEKFEVLRSLLWEMFPNIREACELKDFGGPLLLKWKGRDSSVRSLRLDRFIKTFSFQRRYS